MLDFLHSFNLQFSWQDVVDIVLVAFIFYRLILLIRGTRAVSVIYGLFLLLVVYYSSGVFGLYTLHWLLGQFLGSIFLVVIILFQKDIRKALSAMGAGRFWVKDRIGKEVIDELVLALSDMGRSKTGALVVIERNTPLGDIVERGVEINGLVTRDLLLTIFYPDTPLHDGAVIIRNDRIAAAGCILPLAVGLKHRASLGTRHRAAMGITEESDALAVVVSEERGTISVAIGGKIITSLEEVRLKRVLVSALAK
ncbi:diadenylate cyclase CdaA [Desulfoplanes sp. PS50]